MVKIDRTMSREVYSLCFRVHEWKNEISRNKVAKLVRKARRTEDDQRDGIKIKNMLLDLDYHLCQCSQGACHDMLDPSLNGRMKHR